MSKHLVGSAAELERLGRLVVTIHGRSIGVFHHEGTWFAIRNVCPHHGAELCKGTVSGTVVLADDGRGFDYVMDGRIVRCPWHGFEFDLATGRSLAAPETLRVKTYEVSIEAGSVFVDV